jgi:hypothetical protein
MSDPRPGSFAAGFKANRLKFVRRHDDLKRAVGIKLFSAVILDTPVDTGRLRGNWQASIETPNFNRNSAGDKGGGDAVLRVVSTAMQLEGEESFILTNSLPYAYRIEYLGWSHTKAPRGMVQKNVTRFRNILKEQLTVLKGGLA